MDGLTGLTPRIELRHDPYAGAQHLRLEFDFATSGPSQSPLGIKALIEAHSRVAAFGAFGFFGDAGLGSERWTRLSHHLWRCDLHVPLDARCLQALYRALAFALTHSDSAARSAIHSEVEPSLFRRATSPPLMAKPRFGVDCSMNSDEVTYRLEFQREPTDGEMATLAGAINAWSMLTAAGAFELRSTLPWQALLIPDGGPVQIHDGVFWRHVDAAFDEVALVLLVNIVTAIHERVCPVELLRVV